MEPSVGDRYAAFGIIENILNNGLRDILKRERVCTHTIERWMEQEYVNDLGITMKTGLTKVCIISPNIENWVIKFSSPEFIESCEKEALYYKTALDRGLGAYFAETYRIGEIEGLSIFLQEKVSIDSDFIYNEFFRYVSWGNKPEDYESYEVYEETISDMIFDLCDEERIMAIFGEDISVSSLIEFIDCFQINDLHNGNYGFTKDGRLVIFDFSGYYL